MILKKIPILLIVICALASLTIYSSIAAASSDEIVFLGDSITAGGKWSEMFEEEFILNRGVVSDTTMKILKRLDEAIETSPGKIFIMAGINDLGCGIPLPVIATRYGRIVRRIIKSSPNTRIYIQSTLPVNNKGFGIKIDNRDVMALNEELKGIASRYGLTYIDLFTLMCTSDSQLHPEYTHDGVHLNERAYAIWKSAIKQYVYSN